MNGYDLTDRQKELLRKLVRYIRERKLTEPIAPVSTDQGYFIWFRGGGSLEHQGDLVGDLDALCDAGLMRVRWEKSKRLYNVKQAGYDAVDSDFEVPPSYAGAQSRPRQPVNWGKWEVIVGVIAVLIALVHGYCRMRKAGFPPCYPSPLQRHQPATRRTRPFLLLLRQPTRLSLPPLSLLSLLRHLRRLEHPSLQLLLQRYRARLTRHPQHLPRRRHQHIHPCRRRRQDY
jgi:hypothetical protein